MRPAIWEVSRQLEELFVPWPYAEPNYVTGLEMVDFFVTRLPELQIGKVDHGVYEVVHCHRVKAQSYIGDLPNLNTGSYWSVVPFAPNAEFVTVIEWRLRNEDEDHDPEFCKACRLSCGCGCGCAGKDGIEHKHARPEGWGKQVTTFSIDPMVDMIYVQTHMDGTKSYRIEWGDKDVF